MSLTPGFLLMASVLMEISIAMTMVARVSGYRSTGWPTSSRGGVDTGSGGHLVPRTPPAYYLFFSVIEIACTAAIVRCAWTGTLHNPPSSPQRPRPTSSLA